jgi:N-acetylglucosaminyldiphosphoundecaprenol N-acetyl-beta-D-mannosaminyltransferase
MTGAGMAAAHEADLPVSERYLASPPPGQVELMGLPLDLYTPATLTERLIGDSFAGRGGYVVTPNLDHLRSVTRSPRLMALARAAEVRVADGMPLLWASRIQRTPLPARVTGSDLVFSLSDALARAGRSVFLLGGNPGTAEATADILGDRSPGLRVVGTYCPPQGFEHDEAEMNRIESALLSAAPDFVFVALPFGKATELVAAMRDSLPRTWFLGVGISFSFVCGEVRRAPHWMQHAGLEWLFRLVQEPRRLGRRYIFEGLPFALHLLFASFRKRRRAGSGSGAASAEAPDRRGADPSAR